MSSHSNARLLLLAVVLASGCSVDAAKESNPDDYRAAIERWQNDRIERLKSADGALNLAGLYWLAEGENTIGAGAGNDIVLPAGKAAEYVGVITLEKGQVFISVADGAKVYHDDRQIRALALADDQQDQVTLLNHRKLAWFIIKREEQFALRLRDFENAALAAFPGIDHYSVDSRWRVEATLARYAEPRRIKVSTVIDGLSFNPVSPGRLQFSLDGQAMALEAIDRGDELFVIFADHTSGREIYGAGRFLYTAQADASGRTIIDFNKAYNPPCAFNDFSTCPVAPRHNRLPIAVTAGERYGSH